MTALSMTFDAGHINAALCAVSKEETRYYLRGVFIDARGFIAATNGHIAFAARATDALRLASVEPILPGGVPGIIVPTEALTQAAKGKGATYVIERDAGGLYWLQCGAVRVHFKPIDGSFPEWQRIIPEAPETENAAHYDPAYIAALGNMAKALRNGKKGEASLFHIHQSGENPALVTFPKELTDRACKPGARTDCCAVLMPMRATDHSGFDRNAFLNN